MGDEKKRLDILVMEKGLAESRERARAMIMAGEILVDGQVEDKAGSRFPADSDIDFRGNKLKYVSRGGLKLEKAIEVFDIDLKDNICLDIGASTGGFTDCMLQNGAARVYAVDVGYGQLSWKLRNDERVIPKEKTNFRYMKAGDLPEKPVFAACDVSFISLSKILPAAYELLDESGRMVCLIKPQFEAGKEKVGKKGVVRDPAIHEEVITDVINYAEECGFSILGLDHSPIRGPEGNIEYLLYAGKDGGSRGASGETGKAEDDGTELADLSELIRETVKRSHEEDK